MGGQWGGHRKNLATIVGLRSDRPGTGTRKDQVGGALDPVRTRWAGLWAQGRPGGQGALAWGNYTATEC